MPGTAPTRLLLVDDEPSIREPLSDYLAGQGFAVVAAASAAEARRHMADGAFDLIVSDIMMPGEDGLSLTRHVRAVGDTPVILLTARTEETERIVGLEVGADDYVAKPFSPRELVARIRVILRRVARSGDGAAVVGDGTRWRFGDWVLNEDGQALTDPAGVDVALSTGEFRLLRALVQHPRQVMSRDRLLDIVRGREADIFDRAIDNLVARLRKKVEADAARPEYIKTVWGGGYTLACDVRRIEAAG